ncbi:uncharacterized protein [Dermacentor andersoni]|uniref:uncharacterized protein n=1 Tax=Dermacentor andersoni TaxID=34620 RepID=UPI002417C9F3|nr:uncharacterized protein LOC126540709 [Dermacentor andersoni]
MACSNNLCICPSASPGPMTAHGSLCYATDPSSSWMSLLLPLSGFVLIILAVCVCASTQWSSGPRWAKSYIGDKESAPTLIVWSQASIGDQTLSGPLELHPASQNTDSLVQQQQHMDSELFSGGFYSPRDSWLAAMAERSSELTNQLNSVTELRGLCSAPDEPFVRPVLSGEEMYSKYPHLRLILSSTSSSSAQVAPERPPTSPIPVHTEITLSASRQSTEARLRLGDSPTGLEKTFFIVWKSAYETGRKKERKE